MIILEHRIVKDTRETLRGYEYTESHIEGYFLTIDDLKRLVRDFQADCHDGFVSNDLSYIESWLNKHERIEKK
jgi:hypothetical protein